MAQAAKVCADCVIGDANEEGRLILSTSWNGIIENNIFENVTCLRKSDGRIKVEYKENPVKKIKTVGYSI